MANHEQLRMEAQELDRQAADKEREEALLKYQLKHEKYPMQESAEQKNSEAKKKNIEAALLPHRVPFLIHLGLLRKASKLRYEAWDGRRRAKREIRQHTYRIDETKLKIHSLHWAARRRRTKAENRP